MYSGKELVINMINAAVLELLVSIATYYAIKILLGVQKDKRLKLFCIILMKLFFLNLTIVFYKYTHILTQDETNTITIINGIYILIFFALLKLLTGKPYLKIMLANFIVETFGIAFIVMPTVVITGGKNDMLPYFVKTNMDSKNIIIAIVALLISIFEIFIMTTIIKKCFGNFSEKRIKYPIIWWMLLIIFDMYAFFVNSAKSFVTKEIMFVIVLYVFRICTAILIMYSVSWIIRKKNEKRIAQENKILNIENTVMKEYYRTLKYQMENTEKIKRDIEIKMKEIRTLLSQNNEIDSFEKGICEMPMISDNNLYNYCNNILINSVIENKVRQCGQNEINIKIEADVNEQILVSEIDLIAIIANLFDNAIEESKKLKQGEIEFYCKCNMKELEIKMNNKTLKQSPITIGDTTKKNKQEHGMGQAIIYDIVKKYNGKIKVYVMENRYYTEMVI